MAVSAVDERRNWFWQNSWARRTVLGLWHAHSIRRPALLKWNLWLFSHFAVISQTAQDQATVTAGGHLPCKEPMWMWAAVGLSPRNTVGSFSQNQREEVKLWFSLWDNLASCLSQVLNLFHLPSCIKDLLTWRELNSQWSLWRHFYLSTD